MEGGWGKRTPSEHAQRKLQQLEAIEVLSTNLPPMEIQSANLSVRTIVKPLWRLPPRKQVERQHSQRKSVALKSLEIFLIKG